MTSDDELEQSAFVAANHNDVPGWAQETVQKIWREYCRLEKERDEAKAQLEKAREALRPFADAWNAGGERDATPKPVDFRTAARVHAELAEKEKE